MAMVKLWGGDAASLGSLKQEDAMDAFLHLRLVHDLLAGRVHDRR